VSLLNLKRFGRWKSDSVAQGYIDQSNTQKTQMANQLLNYTVTSCISVTSQQKENSSGQTIRFENCLFQGSVNINK
jgi:hypothetical protein